MAHEVRTHFKHQIGLLDDPETPETPRLVAVRHAERERYFLIIQNFLVK